MGVGIGDTDIFDFGGLIGAVIGTIIVLAFANWYRQAARPPRRRSQPPAAQPPTRQLPVRSQSGGATTF